MANYTLVIPGSADLNMNVGDGLQIDYKSAAKLCVESGNINAFSSPLPSGVSKSKGTIWPSSTTYATAEIAGTITYTHCEHDQNCGGSPTAGGPGTIKIGTGK